MKTKLLTVAILLSTGLSAFGSRTDVTTRPLIQKSSGSGFVMPEYSNSERCDLYADRVILANAFGSSETTGIQVAEQRKLQIKANLVNLIDIASKEEVVETPNGLCDGPATITSANLANGKSLVLYSTGGCGTPSKQRTGFASDKLINLINLYCPKTYTNGMGE